MSLRKITPALVKQYAEELHVKLCQQVTLQDVSTGPDNQKFLACPIGVIALHEGFRLHKADFEANIEDVSDFLSTRDVLSQKELDEYRFYCFAYGFDEREKDLCPHLYNQSPCYAYKLGRRIARELLNTETRLERV